MNPLIFRSRVLQYHFVGMITSSERFYWLTEQLETLVAILHNSADPKERSHLLRRMKVVLNEIDALNLFSLRREKLDLTRSNSQSHLTPRE